MWAWNGFWRLSNVRPIGFDGVLRIPISEVEAYVRMHDFDYAKRQEFLVYVERMDAVYMEHVAVLRAKEEAKRNAPKSQERRGPRRR